MEESTLRSYFSSLLKTNPVYVCLGISEAAGGLVHLLHHSSRSYYPGGLLTSDPEHPHSGAGVSSARQEQEASQ